MLKAYWWRGTANFGDRLTPYILEHFAGQEVVWAAPEDAEIVCAGSVIDVLPDCWDGIIAGAGTLHEDTRLDACNAEIVGVRGYETLGRLDNNLGAWLNPTIGDPGLLASELAKATPNKYGLGVVPHWTDNRLFPRFNSMKPDLNAHLIDISQDPLKVISEIGSCERIVSSSLHGLIVADSFGLPRRAERFDKMTSTHEGGTFKYQDYASAIGQPIEFSKMGGQVAPRESIERIQAHLFTMFEDLEQVLNV